MGRLIDSVSQKVGFRPTRLGFATPGVLDPTSQTMKNCNTTSMNGQPMAVDLAKVVGCEVVLANDANCFALAEALLGAVKDPVSGNNTLFNWGYFRYWCWRRISGEWKGY